MLKHNYYYIALIYLDKRQYICYTYFEGFMQFGDCIF